MEWQEAEELYEDGWCTSQTIFSRWMGGEMVLKCTETSNHGNALETISRRFQRQFPNRKVYNCRRFCSNLDILIVFVRYFLSARCPLIRKLLLKPSDCFQNITGFCILSEPCIPVHLLRNVVWDVQQTSVVQFFCFLLHLSVSFLLVSFI